MVVDYSHGKVYKIYSPSRPDLGMYIGSTTQALSARMSSHRAHFRRWQSGKFVFITSFPIIEAGDAIIVLLESAPCECKEELFARERHWIETIDSVNRHIPGRTDAEYYIATRDDRLAYQREYRSQNSEYIAARDARYRAANADIKLAKDMEYYESHKTEILARCAEVLTCECGLQSTRSNLSRHRKTKKHNDLMEEKATTIPVQPE
jgi:hypothetical protein